MESRENNIDIVIVGGGLVGGTLAQMLAQQGFRVAVIDENDPQHMLNAHVDGRSYAISLGSKYILDQAGIWSEVKGKAHPVESIQVGANAEGPFLTYRKEDVSEEALGFLVDATLLKRAILKRSLDEKNIKWLAPEKLRAFSCDPQGVSISLESGESLQCALLVGADGKSSKLRQDMHIPASQWDYQQLAFVFNVEHSRPHQNTAFEIFAPEGPFAMLPYPDNYSGCVWSMKRKYAEDLTALSPQDFEEEINDRFEPLCGPVRLTTKVRSFPLSACQPHRCIDNRFVLVGDAAHAIHPVAGQGLNLGFRDVGVLAAELKKIKTLGLDIGSQSALRAYQKKRRVDNLSLLAITDTSVRFFSTRNVPMRWALSKGFSLLDQFPSLKKPMIRQAMGLMEEMPAI